MIGLVPNRDGLIPYGLIPDDPTLIARAFGPRRLLALDYTQPTQQVFPTIAAALAAYFDAQASDVAAIIPGDEPTGNLVDRVASKPLVPTNSPMQGKVCAGIYNGTNAYSRKCPEFTEASTAGFVASDTTWLDVDASHDVAMLKVFKCVAIPSGNRSVAGKSVGSGGGFDMQLRNTGRMRVSISDGTNIDNPAQGGGGISAGEIGAALWIMSRVDGNYYLVSTFASAAVPTAITATGSLANANGFTVGSAALAANGAPVQSLYTAVFLATDLTAMIANAQANVDAFLTHAKDPATGGIFPALDTYTRASMTAPEIGDDPAYGIRVAKYGSGQFAHGYHPNFSHASKLGAYIADARTNIVTDSEEMRLATPWPSVNIAVQTSNGAPAPDGSQTLDEIKATADNGYFYQTVTTTAATEYTESFYVDELASKPGSTGRLIMYDETHAAEVDAAAWTTDPDAQRVSLTATTAAGEISTSMRVEIDTSSERGNFWGGMMCLGKPTAYIPTTTTSASRAATVALLTDPGGNTYVKPTRGEVEVVVFIEGAPSASGFIFEAGGSGNLDRVEISIDSLSRIVYRHYDSSGALVHLTQSGALDLSVPHTIRIRWDAEAGVDGNDENQDLIVDGVRTAGGVGTWSASTNRTTLAFGHTVGGATHANCIIATVNTWDGARSEVL